VISHAAIYHLINHRVHTNLRRTLTIDNWTGNTIGRLRHFLPRRTNLDELEDGETEKPIKYSRNASISKQLTRAELRSLTVPHLKHTLLFDRATVTKKRVP
jgi:hypothetical protein